jgi:signal transduction histidine kinase
LHSDTPSSTESRLLSRLALVAALLLIASASWLIVVQFQSGVRDTMLVAIALVSAAALIFVQRRRAAESQSARARTVERAVQLMDEERAEIAHRLHDGPQQLYTAIRLQAEGARHAIGEGDSGRAADALARLQSLASEASEELRQMTARLHPVVMEQQGLVQALSSLGEMLEEQYRMTVEVQAPAGHWPSQPARDQELYEVAREVAVGGARNGAGRVRMELRRNGAIALVLQLQAGDEAAGPPQIGPTLMRERAQALGARLDLHERTDVTEVTLRLPVESASR